jgi:MFS family permease
LPLYIQGLGGTEVEIGIVMGLYPALGIVCQPIVGPWIDAIGRRPFMLLGVSLLFVSTLLAMAASGVGVLALVRAVQGIAFSAYFVATFSYVVDIVPPAARGWALGIYGVSGLASTALAPLVGEWIVRRFGFRPLFVVCAVFALVTGAFVLAVRERRREHLRPLAGGEWRRSAVEDIVQRYMAVTVFFGLGSGTLFAFIPTFADSLGVKTLSLFYTAYAGAAIAVRVFGGRLIDTRGRRAVIVPSMFVQACATAILAVVGGVVDRAGTTPVLPMLMLAGLMAGGSHGFLYPALAAIVADQTPEARRGVVIGFFSAVFLVGTAGGAFLFGYVTYLVGYGPMWGFLTALLLVGLLLSLRLVDARVR